jgi:hypothetical protein
MSQVRVRERRGAAGWSARRDHRCLRAGSGQGSVVGVAAVLSHDAIVSTRC